MLISLIVLLVVCALVFYLLDQISSPSSVIFIKWAKIIIVIIAVLFLLAVLLGHGPAVSCPARALIC